MRGKDYSTGLRGVLFEAQHCHRMGTALWLYGWLVLRQTHQHGSVGWVRGGAPVSYREIEEETGFNRRTLERWMHTLRHHGYIETKAAPGGLIIRISKAKKFQQPPRKAAEGVHRVAGSHTQNCGANERKLAENTRFAGGISSSSVAGSKEREQIEFHNPGHHETHIHQRQHQTRNPNASGLGQQQNQSVDSKPNVESSVRAYRQQKFFLEERMRQQWLRAEREEAVRRELAVGTGPEVRHS
jgi:DNA-binding transcriptional regulator YhcF (GntR family)